MPRSLVRGDYSLVMAVESSSRPNSWYRVLADRQTGLLSCDCPPYIFNRNHDAQGNRFCPHTLVGNRLATTNQTAILGDQSTSPSMSLTTSPLLIAVQEQWPGLRGNWSIEERDANIGTKPYHFVLLRLEMGNGGTATGVVAFANAHHHNEVGMYAGVAGWAGYAIAAEVARLAGLPLLGNHPEHFRIDRSPTTRRRTQPERPTTATDFIPAMPHIGLTDILRVGDIVNQGDGLTPTVRAENTLRLYLGDDLYSQLDNQGFLDISSVLYADRQRVYRMRRDPNHRHERRLRVFESGEGYVKDFCVVKGQDVPEADHFLTVALHLMSDENGVLNVVQSYNVFPPYSDGMEREVVPAVWKPRLTTTMV